MPLESMGVRAKDSERVAGISALVAIESVWWREGCGLSMMGVHFS